MKTYIQSIGQYEKHSLCHDIIWVQVPARSLIDRFHWEGQFHLVTPNLMEKEHSYTPPNPSLHWCVCVCVHYYLSPNDFNPHLFSYINYLRGILDPCGWHLTHMYQACCMRVTGKKKGLDVTQVFQVNFPNSNYTCRTLCDTIYIHPLLTFFLVSWQSDEGSIGLHRYNLSLGNAIHWWQTVQPTGLWGLVITVRHCHGGGGPQVSMNESGRFIVRNTSLLVV